MPSIVFNNATFHYEARMLFDHLTHCFDEAKWHVIIGKSGEGKSTLLKCIAGLEQLHEGSVGGVSEQTLAGQVAYLMQQDGLVPWRNVLDNALLGIQVCRGISGNDRQRAKKLLTQVGLEAYIHSPIRALSGGMRQRVNFVRVCLCDKPIILLDEPFSALDEGTKSSLYPLVQSLFVGKTVVMVTHDRDEASALGEHQWRLSGGVLEAVD